LNNREIAIVFGVIGGMAVGIFGIFFENFASIPVLGATFGQHSFWFKIMGVILSGGVFGNLLSYVGSCIDVFTNHRTIFDLFRITDKYKSNKERQI
jgi:uncharacterized membrane protein YuzA (DUF378 family)